jgi:hypothetical protein
MIENGTRQRYNKYNERPETRFPNNKYTRDVGLNKLQSVSATFTASDSKLTDAATTFTSLWAVNDQIIIWGTASNNGVRTILAVATHDLTLDWPVKDEGPVSCTIRMT